MSRLLDVCPNRPLPAIAQHLEKQRGVMDSRKLCEQTEMGGLFDMIIILLNKKSTAGHLNDEVTGTRGQGLKAKG